jgi:hypothetical protein
VLPEESIVCTIVLIPNACVTVPVKLPAVIVPVAVLPELVSVFVTVAVPDEYHTDIPVPAETITIPLLVAEESSPDTVAVPLL